METFWFVAVVLMLAMYVVLDGFDFGTGIVYLFVGRTDVERRLALRAIGPIWNGNEVWLLAAGGLLFFAFPKAYASGFSGFYLALILVLWLLMFRGLALELRSHLNNDLWQGFWDVAFAGSSLLLAIVFGAALGNIIRGVPLNAEGFFFVPLWTDFTTGSDAGILDWYTILIGVLAAAILTVHGANYLAMKTEGELYFRCTHFADLAVWVVVPLALLATLAIPFVQPALHTNYAANPVGYLLPIFAVTTLGSMIYFRRKGRDVLTFFASCLFILSMLGSAAWGLFPNILIATTDPAHSLTAYNTAASPYGLSVGLIWFPIGISLVAIYTIVVHRAFWGKVELSSLDEEH